MKKTIPTLILIGSAFMLFAGGTQDMAEEKPLAMVSILPQQYLVDRIAGDRIESSVLVPPGKSPANYEPLPSQILELGKADVLLTIGVPFEAELLSGIRSNLPELNIVDVSEGIPRRFMEEHHHDDEEEAYEVFSPDLYVWMSPYAALTLAENTLEQLIAIAPEFEAEFQDRAGVLIGEIMDLDARLAEELAPLKGESLLVYHPAFGYFADRYGMHQIAIETGGDEPTPRQIEILIETALEEDAHVLFVQPEFSLDSASIISEAADITPIEVSTLVYDYLENMEHILETLLRGFE